ncbi:hypothetical protein [Dyella sp.]|jgi:hypothetical protein|uniref:hypothetical protein n=1 Tax=Dyella sp. TaxID=1869338 RepID=UPI002D76E921|nr:hypothetical protein [Dyella sp.]HET6433623.1 hypothetical protein [Dyella sp.]
MNEQERRANQALRALDEAHRSGRITREDYRARRRALLGSLCDSDGITARNALTPAAAAAPPRRADTRQMLPAGPDIASALFPDRRRLAWRLWLVAFGGLGLCALLLYAFLQAVRP